MEGLLFRKRIWPLISNVLEFTIGSAEGLFWLCALTSSPGVKRKNFGSTCSLSPLLQTWMILKWMSREDYCRFLGVTLYRLLVFSIGPKHVVMEGACPQHWLPTLQPLFQSFLSDVSTLAPWLWGNPGITCTLLYAKSTPTHVRAMTEGMVSRCKGILSLTTHRK